MSASFEDRQDYTDADRGLLASRDGLSIIAADGRRVWDMEWEFLDAACPPQRRTPPCGAKLSSRPSTDSMRSPTASTKYEGTTSRT